MGRKVKDPNLGPQQVVFYKRPIDQRLLDFLQMRNTLSVSNTIRMALAFHAASLGMNVAKLMEEIKESESTPA